MITKEDFLKAEFLKQFKDSKEFTSFMEEPYVRGTEKMLEGEIDVNLGYWLFRSNWFNVTLGDECKKCLKMIKQLRKLPCLYQLNLKY